VALPWREPAQAGGRRQGALGFRAREISGINPGREKIGSRFIWDRVDSASNSNYRPGEKRVNLHLCPSQSRVVVFPIYRWPQRLLRPSSFFSQYLRAQPAHRPDILRPSTSTWSPLAKHLGGTSPGSLAKHLAVVSCQEPPHLRPSASLSLGRALNGPATIGDPPFGIPISAMVLLELSFTPPEEENDNIAGGGHVDHHNKGIDHKTRRKRCCCR
jgi:hypothetical protein